MFLHRHIANTKTLSIKWYANLKAWITTNVFEKLILDFKLQMLVNGKISVAKCWC